MDNLCHTLLGMAIGQAGLARRTPRGLTTLVIASNVPDIDVGVFATSTMAVSFRRGWTHGVLAQAVLPLALAAAVVWWTGRRGGPGARARFLDTALLAYVGVVTHVGLDLLNTYGVRLLMPWSHRWFYGDSLYIVDPFMYLFLGGAVWLAVRRNRAGRPGAARIARTGLVLTLAYVLAMLGSGVAARRAVEAGLARAGRSAGTRLMVTPVFANPFRREVVIDMGGRYEKGTVWFEPAPRFRPGGFGIDTHLADPEVQAALGSPRAHAFLAWWRFPFAAVDHSVSPPRIWLNDYRYANTGAGGWSATSIAAPSAVE